MKKYLKISLFHLVTLILMTLQLAGVISVSWWVVFAPSIIALILAIAVIIMMVVLVKSGKLNMNKFMEGNEKSPSARLRKSIETIEEEQGGN